MIRRVTYELFKLSCKWKKLLDNSKSMDITGMTGLKPIVEVVPNFMDATASSPLFEMRAGNAELLFCGFDLDGDDAPSMQLKSCICKYIESPLFKPEYIADANMLNKMLKDAKE